MLPQFWLSVFELCKRQENSHHKTRCVLITSQPAVNSSNQNALMAVNLFYSSSMHFSSPWITHQLVQRYCAASTTALQRQVHENIHLESLLCLYPGTSTENSQSPLCLCCKMLKVGVTEDEIHPYEKHSGQTWKMHLYEKANIDIFHLKEDVGEQLELPSYCIYRLVTLFSTAFHSPYSTLPRYNVLET